jgi:hypothetical protein
VAFLVISVCSYGIFGAKSLHPDVLRNFTVKALSPLVWTRLAQAGKAVLGMWVGRRGATLPVKVCLCA